MGELKIPQGYKLTEVGMIPEDWDCQKLENLVVFNNGAAHENHIKEFGKFVVVNSKFISTEGLVAKYSDQCFSATKKNNILMVMSDVPNGRAIAKCFLVDDDNKYTVNQRICSLEPTSAESRFIFYILNRNKFYLQFDDGAKQTNLRRQDVLDCPLPIPNRKEQTAIANALSDVDALISSLEKLINKKQAIKTASMQQLLTGKTRLPQFAKYPDGKIKGTKQSELGEVPEDWEVVKFTEVTQLITCGIAATPTYVSQAAGFPFLSSTNVKSGRIIWENFKYISKDLHTLLYKNNPPLKGDVLYSRVGTIGEAAVIEESFEFSVYVSLTLIKPKKNLLDSYFLAHLLNSSPYKSRAKEQVYMGGGVGNLNVDVVRNYPIPLPSIEEQTAIATILSDMDTEIQTLEQRLNKTRQIKQGMMQELLTGKTRLRAEAING